LFVDYELAEGRFLCEFFSARNGFCFCFEVSREGNLDAFLILASANAALDQQEEASKAATEIKRIKPDFLLKKYAETQPYRDPKILKQVTSMLQRAGVQ